MTQRQDAVVVFAKAPVPGRVKTRLCPPLSFGQAAQLYRAFILDTLACARSIAGVKLLVAYADDGASPELNWLKNQPGFDFFPQEGGDLGERLVRAFDSVFQGGAGKAVIIGSDAPQIRPETIRRALDSLSESDAVLGPAEDGGYYLIGLKERRPELFQDVPWSTDKAFEETLTRARSSGLKVSLLAPMADMDTVSDVINLGRELRGKPPEICPATGEVMNRLITGGKESA
ncbi:MAG: TIGR04282 family arsenosugar biosynthesis glycosyltransferase [Elusimicrobia bacterium]|nr:TIGR04282 family arsenosugar biosynthesis glycosyltransferase [Elusimicrobiota bacterium]MDE2314699.1 TIGR04282 family arsenosugar biosynthesis glycosyltransferase [Elusimicrobiota bacterium]